MATNSSILAWRIPWTEESGELQSMGLQTVGNNLVIAFGELTKVERSRLYPQTSLINLSRGGIQESAFFFFTSC